MRVRELVCVSLLLLMALGSASATLKSNSAAVTLVARVSTVLELQAGEPAATSGSSLVVSTGQNEFTVVFMPTAREAAFIEVPILMKANVNDVLFRAACDCVTGAYISLNKTAVSGELSVSRPTPLGPDVAFALVSGFIENSGIPHRAPVPGLIGIAVGPSVAEVQPITIRIRIEALRR